MKTFTQWISSCTLHLVKIKWTFFPLGLMFLIGPSLFSQIAGGTAVPVGEYEAVGELSGCTATLIGPQTVLTAAHCVCSDWTDRSSCKSRAFFTLKNVRPVDNPSTSIDESLTRQDISIEGTVRVFPDYSSTGWLSHDFAIIELDQMVSELALNVKPIPVEIPSKRPNLGDRLTLIGYGITGANCDSVPMGKRRISLPLFEISTGNVTLRIGKSGKGACPGDSGGPALNASGNIVGVASTSPGNYDPTYLVYNWLFDIGKIKQIKGKLTFLRVHDINTGYGPPTDPIDGEVVIKLDTKKDYAFGFKLREGNKYSSNMGMLEMLRSSFTNNFELTLDYIKTGPKNAEIIRIANISK